MIIDLLKVFLAGICLTIIPTSIVGFFLIKKEIGDNKEYLNDLDKSIAEKRLRIDYLKKQLKDRVWLL